MTRLAGFEGELAKRLTALAAEGDVPGAAAAVMLGDEIVSSAAGVRNIATGEPATTDTLWQIGSISKIYTAALVIVLAEQGRIDVDAPVARGLPNGRLVTAQPGLAAHITGRQLLTHSSGLDADRYFHSEGGPGASEAFLEALKEVDHVFPPGRAYSYSNPGYGVLEALVSFIDGRPFAEALGDRLIRPLGARATEVALERAVSHRLALGHVRLAGEASLHGPRWRWLDVSPGVGGVAASMTDVLRLARLHLRGGEGLLSPASVQAMQAPAVATPVLSRRSAIGRGLGWAVYRWGDLDLIGHDGDTVGQQALLLLAPARDFAFVAAGNSNRAGARLFELATGIIGDLLGAAPHEPPVTPETPLPCEGRYERLHLAWEVGSGAHGLTIRALPDALFAPGYETAEKPLRPLGGRRYAIGDEPDALRLEFLDLEGLGRATHLHLNGRAHRLVPTPGSVTEPRRVGPSPDPDGMR